MVKLLEPGKTGPLVPPGEHDLSTVSARYWTPPAVGSVCVPSHNARLRHDLETRTTASPASGALFRDTHQPFCKNGTKRGKKPFY
jgi:hypothetical protein